MDYFKFVLLGTVTSASLVILSLTALKPLPAMAQNQPTIYEECFFGAQEPVDIDNAGQVEEPEANRLIKVPSGWTIVSSGGSEDVGVVLFCH